MPRYKLTIAYDGTDFCGWQKQEPLAPWAAANHALPEGLAATDVPPPGDTREVGLGRKSVEDLPDRPGRVALRTVQHVLERAVREVVREPVVVRGSSRTDSGVHARGQVAAFSCSGDGPEGPDHHCGWPLARGVDKLRIALNGRLPEDCLVTLAEAVPQTFDPIGDTESKGYSYTMHTSRVRALFDRRLVHHVWEPLNVEAMAEAAAVLVGEHDFAAFAAAGHGRLTTVRRVLHCTAARTAEDRVRIDISGTGFLWNMVRIIAGTLAEVGRGRMTAAEVRAALESRDRANAGPTFPARGLCLEWIRFRPPGPENQGVQHGPGPAEPPAAG